MSLSATGGTGTISYSGDATTGLTTGSYNYTATDANGCIATTSATITNPSAITYTSVTATDISCNGSNGGTHDNGTATVNSATGGTGTLSYSWSNGSTSNPATSLTVGTYSVTITDANGCTNSTGAATVGQPAVLAVTATPSSPSCNTANGGNHSDGGISTSVSGGTGSDSYAWTGGASGANPTGLAIGTYSVMVTDANGCTTTSSATVTQPSAVTLAWSGSSPQYDGSLTGACGSHYFVLYGYDASISATSSGGTGTLTYHWSGGTTNTTGTLTVPATGTAPGSYTVYVADANSCTTSTVTACAVDVRCSTPGNSTKTQMCRNGHTICVDDNAVASQLASGATVGACGSWRQEEQGVSTTIDRIKLYPNPNDGTFSVMIPAAQKDAVIMVTDITGRVITNKTITDNAGNAISLSLGNVATGMYLVKVNAGEYSTVVKVEVTK
jgi:hypothetical protein